MFYCCYGPTGPPLRLCENTRSTRQGRRHNPLALLGGATAIQLVAGEACVCCVLSSHLFLGVRFVDVSAGVTQEEGHTGFLHLPPSVLTLIFPARRIQPFLSLVDREVEFCVLTIYLIVLHYLLGIFFFSCEEKPQFV